MVFTAGRLIGLGLLGLAAWRFHADVGASIAGHAPAFQTLKDIAPAAPAFWVWACGAALGVVLLAGLRRSKPDRFSPKRA
ncbi:MAG: hypothetical protein ACFB2Z_11320 [Maricaulaceae bacterium]